PVEVGQGDGDGRAHGRGGVFAQGALEKGQRAGAGLAGGLGVPDDVADGGHARPLALRLQIAERGLEGARKRRRREHGAPPHSTVRRQAMPEEALETQELKENLEESRKRSEGGEGGEGDSGWTKWLSLSTAVIAVLAAVASLMAGTYSNDAILR